MESHTLKHFWQLAGKKYARYATYFIALSMAMVQPLGHAADALPQLGDGEAMAMSVAAEKQLGRRIAREIYRDPDYIDDPLITAYVQRIWQPLLAAARKRGDIAPEQEQLAWEIMIGKDRSINAFALPGGYFGLHLGLIGVVSTRDELASVLAHELTHVSQRHIARQIGKQNQQSPWLMGAMILGAIAASKNPQAAGAVISGAQAVSAQTQLNFSRDMEREADRIGFSILQEAGMDVRGFTGMFDKLQNANRINDNGSFPYLRTHPLTTERLGDMQSRLQLMPPSKPIDIGQQTEHAMMTTRARLLSDGSVDNLRAELTLASAALRNSLAVATSNPASPGSTAAQKIRLIAQLYGGSLASSRQRDATAALRYAQAARELIVSMPLESVAGMEYAHSAIELIVIEAFLSSSSTSNDLRAAAQAALRFLRSRPTQKTERATLLAWAQMAAGDAQLDRASAIDALQTHLAKQPGDSPAWISLATLYDTQNQTLRSLRASAEARVALLDYGAALDRLKAAQEWARANGTDHIEASILDTRTRTVQALVRELQNDRDKP